MYFRFSIVEATPTIGILDNTVNTLKIGEVTNLSPLDIITLNKAYSCFGTESTKGGGSYQVCTSRDNNNSIKIYNNNNKIARCFWKYM
jgi:hypothetical protein